MALSDEIARQDAVGQPREDAAKAKRRTTLANCRELAELFRSNGMKPPAPYFRLASSGAYAERQRLWYRFEYLGGYWRISQDEHITYGLNEAGLPVVLHHVDKPTTYFSSVESHMSFDRVPDVYRGAGNPDSSVAYLQETDIYATSAVGIDLHYSEAKLADAFRTYRGPAPESDTDTGLTDEYLIRALGVQVTYRIKPELRRRLTKIYPALAETIEGMHRNNRGSVIDGDPKLIERFVGIFSNHGVIAEE